MSFNGATSGDSLLLPVPANVKRKRGLSLRSQLLNKSLWTHTDINDDPKSNNRSLKNSDGLIQNIELDVMEENSGPNTTPHINIIHDDEEPKDYQPYNTLNSNMSRSTTQLTYASSRSDLTSIGSNTYLGPGPRYRRRNRFYKFIKRILGQNDLQPTENGRIIPLSLNKSDANSYFLQEFYDTYNKSYLDERSGEPYCSNLITSSKYNIYTFLPLQLKAQFSKIANCYFMVVAIMQMIPSCSLVNLHVDIDCKRRLRRLEASRPRQRRKQQVYHHHRGRQRSFIIRYTLSHHHYDRNHASTSIKLGS